MNSGAASPVLDWNPLVHFGSCAHPAEPVTPKRGDSVLCQTSPGAHPHPWSWQDREEGLSAKERWAVIAKEGGKRCGAGPCSGHPPHWHRHMLVNNSVAAAAVPLGGAELKWPHDPYLGTPKARRRLGAGKRDGFPGYTHDIWNRL